MTPPKRRAVFLDRDGTLHAAIVRNGLPYPPDSIDDVVIFPGVPEALRTLRARGFLLIVVTNQPDVARGTRTRASVEAIDAHLSSLLPLTEIRVCYDDKESFHKKPGPGMLLDAARDWEIDLARSYMMGDRWKDIEAGRAAGCRTLFIDHGYSETLRSAPDITVTSAKAGLELIIEETQ